MWPLSTAGPPFREPRQDPAGHNKGGRATRPPTMIGPRRPPHGARCNTVPPEPTAKTSLPLAPQTPQSAAKVPLVSFAQLVPLEWRIVPAFPTANTSLPVAPHTPSRRSTTHVDWPDQ